MVEIVKPQKRGSNPKPQISKNQNTMKSNISSKLIELRITTHEKRKANKNPFTGKK